MHQGTVAGEDPEVRQFFARKATSSGPSSAATPTRISRPTPILGHLYSVHPNPGLFDPLHHRPHAYWPFVGE